MARKVEKKRMDDEWLAQVTHKAMRVGAVYRTVQALEHRGNPLVEALTPYLQSEQPGQYFSNYPISEAQLDAIQARRSQAQNGGR